MTITKNILLAPTGIRRIKDLHILGCRLVGNIQDEYQYVRETMADIWFTRSRNAGKKMVNGTSPSGIAWMFKNMREPEKELSEHIEVSDEAVEELKELMEKDGLTVEER